MRLYQLPDTRVKKAIRQLGDEVSSVAFSVPNHLILWLAAGRRVRILFCKTSSACSKLSQILCFDMSSDKLVLAHTDAKFTCQIITDDADDILNEVLPPSRDFSAPNSTLAQIALNKTHLAFTCDSGRVGVLDIANPESSRFLRPQHESVSSIPTYKRRIRYSRIVFRSRGLFHSSLTDHVKVWQPKYPFTHEA